MPSAVKIFVCAVTILFFAAPTVCLRDPWDAMPDAKPPTTVKAPPAGRKFPCLQCGAKLDFDPAVRGLRCPYCGYAQEIARDVGVEVLERDYLEYLDKQEANGRARPGHGTETRCPGCGAVVILDDTVAIDSCPFCTTFLESAPVAAAGLIAPESVIPFQVDGRAAREAFTRWIESRWFAPTELRTVLALGRLAGIYLPYWTYDAMTYSAYEGERGEDYLATERYVARLADGRTETRSRTVTRTRWYDVSGEVQNFFDDVLVPASHSLSAERLGSLGHFKLTKLLPFDAAYLSGFQAERYAVTLKAGLKTAKELIEPEILTLIRQDIGGDHQRIQSKKTRYSAITFKHVLLPAWVAAYRYDGTLYQITVNGQTGEVSGERPWSTKKLAALALAILVAVALVTVLVLVVQGR